MVLDQPNQWPMRASRYLKRGTRRDVRLPEAESLACLKLSLSLLVSRCTFIVQGL